MTFLPVQNLDSFVSVSGMAVLPLIGIAIIIMPDRRKRMPRFYDPGDR